MDEYNIRIAARESLGFCGRMLDASKSDYSRAHPTHTVVFNANVCTESHGKIWFGDIDVTRDEAKLIELAEALGENVHVLYEMDGRFDNEESPAIERAVYSTGAV